jgi:hypothetical protein
LLLLCRCALAIGLFIYIREKSGTLHQKDPRDKH